MLLNLSQDVEQLVKDVVEAFGNRRAPSSLFDLLFGTQKPEQLSFICNDEMHVVSTHVPSAADLAKWDSGEYQTDSRSRPVWSRGATDHKTLGSHYGF